MPILVKKTIDELLQVQKQESELPVSRVLLEQDEPRLGEYTETPDAEPAPMPESPEPVEQPVDEEVNVPEPGEDVPLPETETFEPPDPESVEQPRESLPEPVADDVPLPETTQAVAPEDFEVQRQFPDEPQITDLPETQVGSTAIGGAQWENVPDGLQEMLSEFTQEVGIDTSERLMEMYAGMRQEFRDTLDDQLSMADRTYF